MNEKLEPEVRVKVASATDGLIWVHGKISGHVFKGRGGDVVYWNPADNLGQKDALTRTAARLIEQKDVSLAVKRVKGMDDSVFEKEYAEVVRLYASLGVHLANDDVDALERLVAELKGFV